MNSRPISETQNPLTRNLDVADPTGMLRLFRQVDAQMFVGWDTYPGILDEEKLEALARVSFQMSELLTGSDNVIILSGAGTSGRLAHLLALEFNRILRDRRLPEIFKPLIAGGDAALIQAQEAAEDSVAAATRDMKELLSGEIDRGLYIGITAGISAPYVAGQLDLIGGNAKFNSVLLGFNPATLARDKAIEGWNKTVKQVIETALQSDRFTLLNPVVGPEAVTGSTRMKGGSATKILLETAFATALDIVSGSEGLKAVTAENMFPLRELLLERLRAFRDATDAAYSNVGALAELVRLAGTALRSGGRIHYLGRGMAGLLGIMDASECPPTFGADMFDVRGYVFEGWELLGSSTSAMSARGKAYQIGHEYFEREVLPEISKGDLVIGICVQKLGDNTRRLLNEAAQLKAKTALLMVTTERPSADDLPDALRHTCIVETNRLGFGPGVSNEAELTLKLCLNAITTGGHVMAGKIYTNVMIDLRISNAKLYDRAVGLVANLTNTTLAEAQRALHHAIFRTPPKDEDYKDSLVSMSVQRAIAKPRIIPLAILLATKKFTLEEAEDRLEAEPRVRRIIEEALGNVAAG